MYRGKDADKVARHQSLRYPSQRGNEPADGGTIEDIAGETVREWFNQATES